MQHSQVNREEIDVDSPDSPPAEVADSQVKLEPINVEAGVPANQTNRQNRHRNGAVSKDEGKRVATEAMHRVGAMRSKTVGHGYYECKHVDEECAAECVIKKSKAGVWSSTWSAPHKQGCRALGAQPAYMQETAMKYVKENRAKTRVDIQGHTNMRAFSGNAFGQDRIYKQLQRRRDGCRKVENLLSLHMVAASVETCVADNDVSVAYRSWEGVADPYDPVDVSLGDWDANAAIPAADSDVDDVEVHEEPALVPEFLEVSDDEMQSLDAQPQQTAPVAVEPVKPVAAATNSVSMLVSRKAL